MASLDVNRPAAMEQLAILGQQIGVDTLPIVKGEDPVAIAKRAKTQASLGGYDVYMLDTAGPAVHRRGADGPGRGRPRRRQPARDAAGGRRPDRSGRGATARELRRRIGITGVVLTRMDGDGRGGAALSMRAITGKPIRFVGLGEKMDALETFEPSRIAGRILGMGDIVALVEKAQETLEAEQAERMMKRFQKGQFNMNDLKGQLEQMMKMGGMQGMMGMMPGMAKMQKQLDEAGFDDTVIAPDRADQLHDQEGTRQPRSSFRPAARNASPPARAGGVSDLNKLLKMHRQMADAMKKLGKMGKKGMMRGGLGALMGKGTPQALKDMDPASMDPKAMEAAARQLGQGGLPGLGGGALPPGLSGFGKKK
jgi:signal recognition particle subunit SRP54